MTPEEIRQFHLLEMRRAVALIEHENLCAHREQTFGGWQYDHTASIHDLETQYAAAKTALLSTPKMTFAEQLFTALATARTQGGGHLPDKQWMEIVQRTYDKATAKPPRRKPRRGQLPPVDVYQSPPLDWRSTAHAIYPGSDFWGTEWCNVGTDARERILRAIAKKLPCHAHPEQSR